MPFTWPKFRHRRRGTNLVGFLLALIALICPSSSLIATFGQNIRYENLNAINSAGISASQAEQKLINQRVSAAKSDVKLSVSLSTQSGKLMAPSTVQFSSPLGSHQVFGFAPYWTINEEASYPYSALTIISYFSVGINPDGTIYKGDAGYSSLNSPLFNDMVARAKAAHVSVELTISCFGNSALSQLTSNPQAPSIVASEIVPVLANDKLDGLNIDFEGSGDSFRYGLTRFIISLSALIKNANPSYQITVDTYASSAQDPFGPFDIRSLSPAVDAFFVMGYSMADPQEPAPNAALANYSPSDAQYLYEYAQTVNPKKVILGIPYYGFEWPTSSLNEYSQATGPATAISYAQIKAGNWPQFWDPSTSTPWTSFVQNGQDYEIYYDDPASVALKVALASQFGIAGVGVWALGMDGNDPQMTQALLGGSIPVKISPANYNLQNANETQAQSPNGNATSSSNPASTSSSTITSSSANLTTTTQCTNNSTTTTSAPSSVSSTTSSNEISPTSTQGGNTANGSTSNSTTSTSAAVGLPNCS